MRRRRGRAGERGGARRRATPRDDQEDRPDDQEDGRDAQEDGRDDEEEEGGNEGNEQEHRVEPPVALLISLMYVGTTSREGFSL